MDWFLIALIAGAVLGVLFAIGSGPDDYEPPKRRQPDLFALVVGIALGAALFGDDDDE